MVENKSSARQVLAGRFCGKQSLKIMKIFPAAARGVALATIAALAVTSCTPKAEEPSSGIAMTQPTISSEPVAKPTSRTPIPTPLPTKKGVKVHPVKTRPGVKVHPAKTSSKTKVIDGMRVTDVIKGTGAEAVMGKTVVVDYRGTLLNGTVFDESYKRGQPFDFVLGRGDVITGWDKGVAGMKVGGKRRLIIPPALAYGDQGAGQLIGPGATLIFEVELKDVQ